jgi:hypothetical protein
VQARDVLLLHRELRGAVLPLQLRHLLWRDTLLLIEVVAVLRQALLLLTNEPLLLRLRQALPRLRQLWRALLRWEPLGLRMGGRGRSPGLRVLLRRALLRRPRLLHVRRWRRVPGLRLWPLVLRPRLRRQVPRLRVLFWPRRRLGLPRLRLLSRFGRFLRLRLLLMVFLFLRVLPSLRRDRDGADRSDRTDHDRRRELALQPADDHVPTYPLILRS